MYGPHKVAYRHPKYKTAYRVKNWPEHEKSLQTRGDIAIWSSQDAIDAWTPPENGKRGSQSAYSTSPPKLPYLLDWSFGFHYVRQKGSSDPYCD